MAGRRDRRRLLAGGLLGLLALLIAGVTGGTPPRGSAAALAAPAGVPVAEAASSLARPAEAAAGPAWKADAAPAGAASVSAPPQLQTARLGVVYSSSEIGIYLAQERGYFAEQGLNADYTRFDSAAFAVTPLSTGELDVVSGVVSAALFNAMNRGLDLRLASPLSRYDLGYSQLIMDVRKDLLDAGAVRDYADLRGRTIGILSFGSTVEMVVERALQRGGLTADDVNLVQMGAPDQITALGNRAIEIGTLTEPQATMAQDLGAAVKWREAADWSPGVQVSNILYGPNYTIRDVDAGRRFMLAYLRGVREYYNAVIANRGGREQIIDVLMRQTPYKDRALYDRILWVYMDPNLTLIEDDLRTTIQWFVDKGLLERPTDLSVAVDRRFAQHALSVLGPYQ